MRVVFYHDSLILYNETYLQARNLHSYLTTAIKKL